MYDYAEPETQTETEKLTFHCRACTSTKVIGRFDDPTSSSGCCPNCGSSNWTIRNAKGEIVA